MVNSTHLMPQRQRLAGVLLRFPRVAPVLAFALAMTGTMLVVVSIEHASRVEQRTEVTERVTALAQDIERRASATQAYLMSGAALFESGMDVDQQTFSRFAATLQSDNDFQGIMALGWSVRMKPQQVPQFVADMRLAGNRDFRVWPRRTGAVEPFVDVIKYVAPKNDATRKAIGFDIRSEPVRRAAVDLAERSRRPTISGIIRMLQAGTPDGLIMFVPVYEKAAGDGAGGTLKGFITGGMRADRFAMASIVGQADTKLDLEIYDQRVGSKTLLYRQGEPIATAVSIDRPAQVADHVWIVRSSIAPPSLLGQTGTLVLLAGLIIASLLLFIVRLAIQQALYDRHQLEVSQEQEAIRATLTRELNHRVKNTLANVLSILSLSRRNAEDLDSFIDDFDGRVRALSATYNLLMQTSWGPTSLTSVLQTEMAPYFESDPPRILLEGNDVLIAPNDALSLGLLIHELVTNAAKFGALSNATGRVTLRWVRAETNRVKFDWVESGGPAPAENRKKGFGSDLIEKVISRELRSDIRLDFARSGLRVTFIVPIRQVGAFSLSERRPVAA